MNLVFRKAESEEEQKNVYDLRQKVFPEEQSFPIDIVKDDFDKNAVHFLAYKDDRPVGTISVVFNSSKGLPIEQFFDFSPYKNKQIAQIYRLAVIPEERGTKIALGLMITAYEFAKQKAEKICIPLEGAHTKHEKLFQKFGFKTIGKCSFGKLGKGIVMLLDIDKDSIYEKEKSNLKQKIINSHTKDFGVGIKRIFSPSDKS